MNRTPKTKYGEDVFVIDNHIRYADRSNKIVEINDEVEDLTKLIIKNTKALTSFDKLKQSNDNWYDWKTLSDSTKDNDKLKTLCRVILPEARILSKSVKIKQKFFEDKNITEAIILGAREKMELETIKAKERKILLLQELKT